MHKCLPRDATRSAVFAVVRCPSVRLFVTLMYRNGQFYYQTFSSPGGPIILVFQNHSFPTVKFRRGHPQQGPQIEVGYTKNLRFSTSISEIPIPIPNTEVFQNTDTEYRTDVKKPTKIQNTDTDSKYRYRPSSSADQWRF